MKFFHDNYLVTFEDAFYLLEGHISFIEFIPGVVLYAWNFQCNTFKDCY